MALYLLVKKPRRILWISIIPKIVISCAVSIIVLNIGCRQNSPKSLILFFDFLIAADIVNQFADFQNYPIVIDQPIPSVPILLDIRHEVLPALYKVFAP